GRRSRAPHDHDPLRKPPALARHARLGRIAEPAGACRAPRRPVRRNRPHRPARVSRRQPLADAPEAEPGVYVLETFRAKRDDMEHFRELTEDVWAPWAEAQGGVRLVGMWRSYI